MKSNDSSFGYEEARRKLGDCSQQQLLKFWGYSSTLQQTKLLQQIDALDIDTFVQQRKLLSRVDLRESDPLLLPFTNYHHSGSTGDRSIGLDAIASGEVGALLIAGGVGSRLNVKGPKGTFPITLIKQKSLFQLFAEKVIAAGRLVGRKLPLAIMTSSLNHRQTIAFFRRHGNFGLPSEQLFFFQQSSKPLLTIDGDLFLTKLDEIAMGPDGNGSLCSHFISSGIWEQWFDAGIRHINIIPVDNPLADPYDAELVGLQLRQRSQVALKCVERSSPDEKMGVVVNNGDNGVRVIEYFELTPRERGERQSDGRLKHRCANTGLFCFQMEFIEQSSLKELPWHLARKASKCLVDGQGDPSVVDIAAWKCEKFIFDLLPRASTVSCSLAPRNCCFSPLKNYSGEDSRSAVQDALLQRDLAVAEAIFGRRPKRLPIELAQDFYYPTDALKAKWRNARLGNTHYFEA